MLHYRFTTRPRGLCYTVLSTCIQNVFVFHSTWYVLDLDYDSRMSPIRVVGNTYDLG